MSLPDDPIERLAMTSQPTLPDLFRPRAKPIGRPSLIERLAAFFRAHPDTWIDGRDLGLVAGSYAWRTRVSNLRRPPFAMVIENRQRRVRGPDGPHVVSEYRYVSTDRGD